jgi:hypothetical protein
MIVSIVVPYKDLLDNYKQKDTSFISHIHLQSIKRVKIVTMSTHTEKGGKWEIQSSNSNSDSLLGRC